MFADIGTAVVEMRLKSLFAISLVVIVLLSNAAGQGYVDILPDEVKNPFYARQDIIVKELSKPQASEWVGRYYREPSPTWGEVIVWEPRTGFAAYRDTCSNGPRAWVNYGTVSFDNGVLAITPERDTNSEHVLNFPFRQFTTVKWGQQHWLVPTEELALFAYTVNSRSGEEYAFFYVQDDETQMPAIGQPDLPPQYKKLLGLPAIKASVIEIKNKTTDWYPQMVINAGRDKGVIENMSFWLVGYRRISVKITVADVGERTSVANVTSYGISGSSTREIIPKLGWKFSSRVPSTYF